MKYRLMDLLISPDKEGPLTLKVFQEKKIEYKRFSLIKNPMCSRFCSLSKIKLPTDKKIDCKACYKKEIVSGILTDKEHVYPVIGGIPRLLSKKMQPSLVGYHKDFFKKYKNELRGFNYGNTKFTNAADKKIKRTLKSYSYQWQTFDKMISKWKEFFDDYLYPFNKPSFYKGKRVLEVGCGYGRSMYYPSLYGAEMIGFDLSEAIQSAYNNTSKFPHAHVVQASVYEIPFEKDFDFIYSNGVIQHTPRKDLTFRKMADLTKKGKPLYAWVYSKRKGLYNLIYILRPITTRMPYRLLYVLCFFLAILQYIMFLLPYKIMIKFKITRKLAKKMQYTLYAKYPFRHNFADWFDRLSVPVTDGFSKQRVYNWFVKAGFKDIHVIPRTTGWRGWGVKE